MPKKTGLRSELKRQARGSKPLIVLTVQLLAEGEEVKSLSGPRVPGLASQLIDLATEVWVNLRFVGMGRSGKFEFRVTPPASVEVSSGHLVGQIHEVVRKAIGPVLVGESNRAQVPMPKAFNDWIITFERDINNIVVAKQQVERKTTRDADEVGSLDELRTPKRAAEILAEMKELIRSYDKENEARRSKVQEISDDLVEANFGELNATERRDLVSSFVNLMQVSGSAANFTDAADTTSSEKPVLSIDCVASGGSKGVVLMRGRNATTLHKLAKWATLKIRSVLEYI